MSANYSGFAAQTVAKRDFCNNHHTNCGFSVKTMKIHKIYDFLVSIHQARKTDLVQGYKLNFGNITHDVRQEQCKTCTA